MNTSFTIKDIYRDYGIGLFTDASLLYHLNACQQCPLKEGPIVDVEDPPKDFVIIGDYPGLEEHHGRHAFIGPAGRFLRTLLEKESILDESVAFLNAFLCYGAHTKINPNNPKYYCQPKILYYIAFYSPKVILCMGRYASGVLDVPNDELYEKPAAYHLVTPWFTTYVVTTINPALYLRNKWSDVLYKNLLMAIRLAKCLHDYDTETVEKVSIGFPDTITEDVARSVLCNTKSGF